MTSAASTSDPVFVVGFYRSGTSLLHALLNQHPDIALMYECDVLKLWPLVRTKSVHGDWLGRLEYWNQSHTRHRLDPLPGMMPGNRIEAALSLYHAYAAKKGATVIGEKSPYYHDCLPKLAADFPRSRIIVLWRSRGDVLQSIERAAEGERFFATKDWRKRAAIGTKLMATGCAQLRKEGHSLHEIDYASLVGDQTATMQGICAFLGIPFDARMTSLEGADVSMLPKGEHHRNVRGNEILANRGSTRPTRVPRCSAVDLKIASVFEQPIAESDPDDSIPTLTFRDRLTAAQLAARDAALRFVYAYCPYFLLDRWRAWRCKRFDTLRHRRQGATTTPPRAEQRFPTRMTMTKPAASSAWNPPARSA